ncbi:trehalase family glycosidase [Mucilaginibacter sp. UR6-11]|uniref:MGH1-like glycoside hydrolase domain-containing protein n=1 Tax=Mucilaginibacter sp. UR6-11 TaxID=1435644 RepID=UPI001E4D7274|nr:trehalase family glycosidase [Mucilaginibacter sp. UR6-11]MCC8423599.1 hypothetical protein [Mucilaginibacter sp. UR6-11]
MAGLGVLCAGLLYAQDKNEQLTTIPNALVKQNTLIRQAPDLTVPPTFEQSRAKLPEPLWPARPKVISCYWKTWELAFGNLHAASPANHFIAPYIDPAFNGYIFMWDTNFMALFGAYGHRAFNFQGSLDNFYHTQHADGYISREISEADGSEFFEKFNPSSTGPNVLPWAEWNYFERFQDTARLKTVFPALVAYDQWFRTNRSWPDGSYFSSGWGCGMDNQPRVPDGFSPEFSPAFMSWVDITLQQLYAGKLLLKMAAALHREADVPDIRAEVAALSVYVRRNLWDERTAFLYDRFRDGSLSKVKSIAAYWALLAEVLTPAEQQRFIAHLENPAEFARLHRVPTLSADDPAFNPDGGYWRGGVWAPTSYMVLQGLTANHQDSLAFEIGYNHLNNVVQVYQKTGMLWENYAPDKVQGNDTKNLVGWTGLVPISVLYEYVFGLRADAPRDTLTWDIRLTDAFGVKKYPFKHDGLIDLWCAQRNHPTDKPKIRIKTNTPFTLKLIWAGGSETRTIIPQ